VVVPFVDANGRRKSRLNGPRLPDTASLFVSWDATELNVTADSVLVRDKEPRTIDLDGAAVVLSVRAGAYFDLNRVATEIWDMVAKPCRLGRVLDTLSQRYDVDDQALARDVMPFLQTLVEHRLLRVIASNGSQ
jgi:hypothetical protein